MKAFVENDPYVRHVWEFIYYNPKSTTHLISSKSSPISLDDYSDTMNTTTISIAWYRQSV